MRKSLSNSIIVAMALMALACQKTDCNDPLAFNYHEKASGTSECIYEPVQATLEFNVIFGNQNFALGDTVFMADRPLVIDHYGLYITELALEADTLLPFLSDAALLAATEADEHFSLVGLRSAATALQFTFGVNDSIYTADPSTLESTNALSPKTPTMWWGWAEGYRFMSLSGLVDTSAAADGSAMTAFEYHVGLPQNLRTVKLEGIDAKATNGKLVIQMVFDLEKVLDGVEVKNELSTHTSDNPILASKLADNAAQAFSIP